MTTAKPAPVVSNMNREYFDGTAIGELRVRLCPSCGARFRFSHEWCPECWSLELGWEKVSGRGRVSHVSVVHHAPSDGFATPYALALVDLEEGVRMMANVIGIAPDDVRIGDAVKVVFEQRGDVQLPMFVPDADAV